MKSLVENRGRWDAGFRSPFSGFILLQSSAYFGSLIFLKRDDSHNCIRAASLGLTFADRLGQCQIFFIFFHLLAKRRSTSQPIYSHLVRLEEKPASLPAKLLYRRGPKTESIGLLLELVEV